MFFPSLLFSAEWVKLEYRGGDKYSTHCTEDPGRRAEIMFICDPDTIEVSKGPDKEILFA